MGIAGMILGILAMIFLWIPFVGGVIALLMVAVGLPLSGAGLRSARRNGAGAGMAIAGIVLNVVALAIILVAVAACGSLVLGILTVLSGS